MHTAFLNDENKSSIFYRGVPSPSSGIMKTCKEFYEHFEIVKKRETLFYGVPIASIGDVFPCTDGPFTLACSLRGTESFCFDLFDDTEYASQLLDYITESTITRIKFWRNYHGKSAISPSFFFADDGVAILSPEMYREYVLPYHKKLIHALCTDSPSISIHLCGDASHLFKILKEELNVNSFDTGFPIDHENMTKMLGENTIICGGPRVSLLLSGSINEIEDETKRIIKVVAPHTKKFIMRDANNISPYTSIENINSIYKTVLSYGNY